MEVVALVESEGHVCCRYRITAFQAQLQARGINLRVAPLPKHLFGRWRLYSSLRSADAVILQRKLLSAIEVRLLSRNVRRLIFDYDDALWLRDSYSGRGFESPKRMGRFRSIVQHADDLIAGNEYLAQQARQLRPTARVHIIPTCVDPERYPLAQHQVRAELRLVWVGSSSTLQGLDHFREVLEQIGQQVPNLRLRLICDRFLKFQHLPVEEVVWQEAEEAQRLAECDIGISWVPDDPWSRGKCGLKLLQYQAAGLPVITNPVGVHAKLVPGSCGYLVNTAAEWISAIQTLQANPNLRAAMGQAGREQVERGYSVQVGAQLWEQAIRL